MLVGVVVAAGVAGWLAAGQFWPVDDDPAPETEGKTPPAASRQGPAEDAPSPRQTVAAPRQQTPPLAEPIPLPPQPTPPQPEIESLKPLFAEQLTIEALKEEALKVTGRLADRFPASADAVALMGTVNDQQGMRAAAAGCWQRCLELDSGRADVYDGLGSIAMEKGEYERAEPLLRKALQINPRITGIHHRLARALISQGRTEEAIATLQQGLKLFPQVAESYFLLGQAYLQSKEYGKAKTNYELAVELEGDHVGACYGLAVVCMRLGLPAESQRYSQKFTKLKAARRKGRMERRSLFDYLDMTRRNVSGTHTDAGRIYHLGGCPHHAEELWLRAAVPDAENWICRYHLAELCLGSRRRQEALQICWHLQRMESTDAAFHLNTGVLLARLEQFDAAGQMLEKGLELAPGNTAGHVSLVLGEACQRAGDVPGATAALEKALQLDPGNEKITNTLKRLRQRR